MVSPYPGKSPQITNKRDLLSSLVPWFKNLKNRKSFEATHQLDCAKHTHTHARTRTVAVAAAAAATAAVFTSPQSPP